MTFRCTLDDGDLSAQVEAWKALTPAIVARRRWEGGFSVTYSGDARDRVAALVATEQGCCSWAKWVVEATEQGAILDVTGPPAQIGALAEAFGL